MAHAAVIGAGVMGSGIAQWLSARGITVILRDVNVELIERGLANIEKIYAEAVKRGLVTEDKAREGRARIVASANPGPMRDVQIVIEAASEKLEIKKTNLPRPRFQDRRHRHPRDQHLRALDHRARGGNRHPERVIGLHFFNPVSRMKLIEVVVGRTNLR